MADRRDGARRPHSAPHISYGRFKSCICELKQNSVPERLDESIWPALTKPALNEMIASFGFLGLVDDDARSTDDLRTLVRACGADDWPATLADILRRAYSSLFVGSLADMTPGQFDEKFAAIYSGKEEVRKKCVRFFLSAAEDAKVGVNLRIARRLRPHKNVPDRRTVRRLERPRASVYPKNPSRNWSEGLGDEVDGRRAAIFGDLVADLDALTDVQKTAFMTMLQYFKRLDKTAREA